MSSQRSTRTSSRRLATPTRVWLAWLTSISFRLHRPTLLTPSVDVGDPNMTYYELSHLHITTRILEHIMWAGIFSPFPPSRPFLIFSPDGRPSGLSPPFPRFVPSGLFRRD